MRVQIQQGVAAKCIYMWSWRGNLSRRDESEEERKFNLELPLYPIPLHNEQPYSQLVINGKLLEYLQRMSVISPA